MNTHHREYKITQAYISGWSKQNVSIIAKKETICFHVDPFSTQTNYPFLKCDYLYYWNEEKMEMMPTVFMQSFKFSFLSTIVDLKLFNFIDIIPITTPRSKWIN